MADQGSQADGCWAKEPEGPREMEAVVERGDLMSAYVWS